MVTFDDLKLGWKDETGYHSAAGTHERMRTVSGVQEVARIFASIDLSEQQAAKYVWDEAFYMDRSSAWGTSVWPIVWLKNRLHEDGLLGKAGRAQTWEDHPLVFGPTGHIRLVAPELKGKYARSKFWSTMLIIEPINIVAMQVVQESRRAGRKPGGYEVYLAGDDR